MSKRIRKGKSKRRKKRAPRGFITPQQSVKLQQAMQAQAMGNLAYAEAEFKSLIAGNARTPQLFCALALIYAQSGKRSAADELWLKALSLDPDYLEAQMNLADSHQLAGDLERAAEIYEQVIENRQDYLIARYMLGNILKAQGDLEAAKNLYQQVIRKQPDYTQAHFTYSGIHRYQDKTDPHLASMLGLFAREDLQSENRVHLAFALAKAHEDIGEYASAFDYLALGNDLRGRSFNYDIDGDRELVQNIIDVFNRDAMAHLQIDASNSEQAIFIVGMPRSGTSLVEKIIASHSDVFGAGELETMFALGTSRFRKDADNFRYHALDTYPPATFEQVGVSYLEHIDRLSNEALRVTDKMPFNMMMIGLIHIALPNARIIHCVRDARDTCLSIFKQNFTTGNYRFAYNQRTVAQFYKQYEKLMRHWHECMPGVIYDISYEELTQNPEKEIRALLSACDLEFQESCLHFEKTDAVVKTASAYQVRQPIYTSSVRLWEKYEEFLGPMLDELEQGVDWGSF